MAIRQIVPIIKVGDITRAKDFYGSTLGFTIDFSYSASPSGPTYVGMSLEGQRIHLSTFGGDGVFGTAVYIYVDDIDAYYEKFIARGLKTPGRVNSPVEERPVTQSWGMREFYVKDADGNTMRFGSPVGDSR